MEPLHEEYLANHGTIVKPYYWLSFSLDCSNCPYHIRTGEEARVPYTEFYQIFGFPYGLTYPPKKHLTFYELKTSSGSLVQKGHASSCTGNDTHPESMLFEANGYFDSAIHNNDRIRHIILYSSNSPCNEANHCCISKMYNFLAKYPDITLSIYFSQLYHTEAEFPASAWNRESSPEPGQFMATGHFEPDKWWDVAFSPQQICEWCPGSNCFPAHFNRESSGGQAQCTRNQCHNRGETIFHRCSSPGKRESECKSSGSFGGLPLNNVFPRQSFQVTSGQLQPNLTLDPRVPVVFVLVPYRDLPPIHVGQSPHKPKNIIRHLNMPQLSFQETGDLRRSPIGMPVERVESRGQFASSKEADEKKKKKKGKN